MFRNRFRLVTVWHLEATLHEVGALIEELVADASTLLRVWSEVFRNVTVVERGRADGFGRVLDLETKGWLPYRLNWRARCTQVRPLQRYVQSASGDFEGQAVWTLEEAGGGVRVRLDWRLRANKQVIRRFAFLAKPIFTANHRWAMKRGEESLKRELRRLRELARAA